MAEPDDPEFKTYSTRLRLVALFVVIALFLVVWGYSYWILQPPPVIWSSILFVALVVATAIDLRSYILPDWITLPLVLIGLWVGGNFGPGYFWAGMGALFGFGLIAGLRWLWLRQRGIEAIGLGDAKLLAAGGAWLGPAGIPLSLLVASTMAILVMLLSGQAQGRQAIPFGPFLAVGIWFAWCLGHLIAG